MSHSRPPGQSSEDGAISRIIENREATMGVVVSCSVATALLELKARYWGENPTKEKMDSGLSECLASLRALPQTLPQYAAYKPDLDFIIEKTKEADSGLDQVSLYFPEVGQRTVKLPLREVLPLVWMATNDNPQFMHHYKKIEGESGKLAAAKEDFSKSRALTFLNCLRELRAGVCHHGVRNALVLTLNQTYAGIDILEDSLATIAYFLKGKINEGFWKIYQETEEGAKKDKLMSALFTWINMNNPREVLALIDPDQKLRKELHQLFISNHIDPNYVRLDDKVNEALDSLEFECDNSEELAILRMMNKIMRACEQEEESPQGKALIKTQEWIRKHCKDWKEIKFRNAVTTFYSFYFFHQALRMNQILLTLGGKGEETEKLLTAIQAYFQLLLQREKPPIVPSNIMKHLEALRLDLVRIKKDAMRAEIASFFALWEAAISEYNEEQIKKLYNLLLNEVFQSKILLTEEDIQAFNRSLREAETSGGHKELNSYEVNRFLLQAQIQKPQEWTAAFAAAFREVLAFVKNLPAESLNPNALKKSSYPKALLDQLSYRHALYLSVQPDAPPINQQNPYTWLLPLPGELQTTEEWLRISDVIEEEQRKAVYQRQAVMINRLLKKSLEKNLSVTYFTALLETVPSEHLTGFFKTLGLEILNTFFKPWELKRFLFSPEKASSYLEALGPAYLRSVIRDSSEFWNWERNLPSIEAVSHLLEILGLDHIKGLIKNDKDWIFIYERLTPKLQKALIQATDLAILQKEEIAQTIAPMSGASSSQLTLFHSISTEKGALAVHLELHKFLQHIVFDEREEAEAMVRANPQLLRMKTVVTNYSGQRIEQTAYQLALGADDNEMATMLVPYFEKIYLNDPRYQAKPEEAIKVGLAEKTYQEQEQFSDGLFEDKGKEAADEKALTDVLAAIDASDSNEACETALQTFRDYLNPKDEPIRKGKHFNIQLLIRAFELYSNENKYRERGGDGSRKNNLIWRKVIGYTQRCLPTCYAQAFAQGLYYIIENEEPLTHSLEFRFKQGHFFFPLRPSSGLGYEVAAGGGNMMDSGHSMGARRTRELLLSYVREKHLCCEELCSGLINHRRISVP